MPTHSTLEQARESDSLLSRCRAPGKQPGPPAHPLGHRTEALKRSEEASRRSQEQEDGGQRAKIETYRPIVLAFLGKAAYGAISGKKDVLWGRQSERFGGAVVWVLPNPSGLNRAFPLARLVSAYRELREALDAGEMARA
ncbi:MAG: Uracil-DNA glycosylase superfamily [Devosia sp.]|nr:Uracil-DNA glycosylase superfamily [Devosia sp.]